MAARKALVLVSGQMQQLQSGDYLSSARELLTADRTYYVRTDGSDSNTGLVNNSGGAFLTIQKAYDTIVETLDTGGKTVTIQLGNGTYTGATTFTKPWSGGGLVTISGDTSTPSNVLISVTGSNCFLNSCVLPAILTIQGIKFQTSTGGGGVSNQGLGIIQLLNFEAGACTDFQISGAGPGAQIRIASNFTVNGSSPNCMQALRGGQVQITSQRTVTISGTPAFTQFVRTTLCGTLLTANSTFSGSATGVRYSAETNSVMNTGSGASATYFPGDSAGSTSTGGQYI